MTTSVDKGYTAHPTALVEADEVGPGTRLWAFVHVLKGAIIGSNCNIGDHCFVEGGARIGNDVVVKNGVAVWSGVTVENGAFIGPNVVLTNDHRPRAKLFRDDYDRTLISEGASIGANATLVAPVKIGRYALVGAGAVVATDVPDFAQVYGNAARVKGFVCKCGRRLALALDSDGAVTCACGSHYRKLGNMVTCEEQDKSAQPQTVPFVDLRAQHDEVREEMDAAIADVIARSSFIGGPYVEGFERDFAAYCGAESAIGCGSGTDALKLALLACGVESGDEVMTVPMTFMATAEAISGIGAVPVFIDVDSTTYTIDTAHLKTFVQQRCSTKGPRTLIDRETGRRISSIIPVHLYGYAADMSEIVGLLQPYDVSLIEDACQSHGACYPVSAAVGAGRRAGSVGKAGCFSFYPGKNLGAIGEAGAVVTNDPEIARRVRVLRDHGQVERYIHESAIGWNGRLDALQAAVLGIKLRRLDEWNLRRRQIAKLYIENLAGLPVRTQSVADPRQHVYHLFVVLVRDRDRVRESLTKMGISTGLHYPIPLHLQPAYGNLGYKRGDFPVSEEIAQSGLSLPMYPHMTEAQVERVCVCLRAAISTA